MKLQFNLWNNQMMNNKNNKIKITKAWTWLYNN